MFTDTLKIDIMYSTYILEGLVVKVTTGLTEVIGRTVVVKTARKTTEL